MRRAPRAPGSLRGGSWRRRIHPAATLGPGRTLPRPRARHRQARERPTRGRWVHSGGKVLHEVTRLDNTGGDALCLEVRDRRGCWGEPPRCEVVRDNAVISSGMRRSKLRRPASTWATGMPSFAAASDPASVEFVSPYTSDRIGALGEEDRLQCHEHPAVWCACPPPPTPRVKSGRGRSNSAKKVPAIRSSQCWPVSTKISWWRVRSSGTRAAALMSCGRVPTMLTIFMPCRRFVARSAVG